jgi:hypothetical protein
MRDARLHDARHTAATILVVLGVPERTVMGIMGWSRTSMAARYQHITDSVRAACCGADPEGQDATETELRQRRCSELTDPRAAAHRAWSERGGCGISNQRGHEPKPLSPATRIQEYPRRRNHAHLAVLERVLHPSEHRQLRPELRATAAMCGGKPWRPE